MVTAAILTWAVLAWTVFTSTFLVASLSAGASWALQGTIVFCALGFWLLPLYRAVLRVRNPGRWPRPESAYDDAGASSYGMWNTHLDALSILVPLTAIALSTWLWEMSRIQMGWVVLATALFALLVLDAFNLIQMRDEILAIAALAVLASAILHGLTAAPAARSFEKETDAKETNADSPLTDT
jgi:hypothetical protein